MNKKLNSTLKDCMDDMECLRFHEANKHFSILENMLYQGADSTIDPKLLKRLIHGFEAYCQIRDTPSALKSFGTRLY